MKKTLVALAALAATGAFAQVTMTGELAWATKLRSLTGAVCTYRRRIWLGTDTSISSQLDASEDLGGGMKIAASPRLLS